MALARFVYGLWLGSMLRCTNNMTLSYSYSYWLLLALATTLALVKSSRLERQRGLALTALLLWFSVGFSGRLIGFL